MATGPSPRLSPDELKGLLRLTDAQVKAVVETEGDVIVTAGAGTGKTQTLVARYLWHLAQGLTPRQVAAVTFTEKAAREMRNRIREVVSRLATLNQGENGQAWAELEAQLDSARIGTIHSLCAEILRSHPIEAGVDPGFEVVDEGWATALKAQSVQDALAWGVADRGVTPIFTVMRPQSLARVVTALLERRLDAEEFAAQDTASDDRLELAMSSLLSEYISDEAVSQARGRLHFVLHDKAPADAPTEAMLTQVRALAEGFESVGVALRDGRSLEAAGTLFELRRNSMRLNLGRKGDEAHNAVSAVREAYDDMLNPWLTGAKSGDEAPNSDLEARYGEDLIRLVSLFKRAQANYRVALESRRALDFDDLEGGARRLLEDETICRRWRASILRILVDEYQDTNPRQQAILDALTGDGQGALFVVGDARQSIYRFRGADVTVFRRLMLRRSRMGGRTFELSTTFRTHTDLLAGMDEILGHVMGDEDSERLYEVPYTRLDANRLASEISPPYLEVVAGLGTSAEEARARSGQALTRRLLELRATGEIQSWAQVALLFRASSGFDEYERSLESAGIPFVTVAGRGFYDRPEIRDVLNSLAVLADPTDDLAVAGFLRSPAIGMSDLGIFQLRGLPGQHGPMWPRLQQGSPLWSPEDREAAEKARLVLGALLPQVDRLPAAELIKRLVDALNLRAALAASHSRLWRNVDKLIDDAQASQVVRLSEFLAYLRTLRTVGAREGEAPAEAEGSVRLMTIHKAKGLEFDVAVLADASRRPYTAGASVYFSPTVGLAFRPDRLEGVPLAFRLAAWGDSLQAQAESLRLLYVALTRAREKLIICGHISQPRGSWMADGWFGQVLEALGLSADDLAAASGPGLARSTPAGQPLSISVADETPQLMALAVDRPEWPSSKQADLFRPLQVSPIEHTDTHLDEPDEWLDRATGEAVKARGLTVGRMVHLAIERGWGTSAEGFRDRMLAEARRAGLALESQRRAAVDETQRLLDRLYAHPFWGSIQTGNPRLSEVPFTTPATAGVSRSGRIDLLLRTPGGWTVVDFKTEHVPGDDQLAEVAQAYFESQLQPYVDAVQALVGERPLGRLCFLDVDGQVRLVDLPSA